MKVLVAIDSYKGSLTSMEAGLAAKEGILRAHKDAEVIVKPLADGGEGTTKALVEGLGGKLAEVEVMGPLGANQNAYYGCLEESDTVVMEMAVASGLDLLKTSELNPLKATTYGVGEMIKDAITKGYRKFIIGIGGSATNDGGLGMLMALGFEFLDQSGASVGLGAQALEKIVTISDKNALKELKECSFQIACDVINPLYGQNGATYIFGPQKGVTEDIKEKLDQDMMHYANISKNYLGQDHSNVAGTGAAGGLGFAFLAYLNGTLVPGIDLILDAIKLSELMPSVDYVITGEGRMDAQTAMGKVPVGVAKCAKEYDKKVLAFAGSVTSDVVACNDAGIDGIFPILRSVVTLEEAMSKDVAKRNMTDTVEQVFRIIK